MNMEGRLICGTIIIVLATTIACNASNGIDFKPLDKAVVDELNSTNTPGCAVAVVSGDKIIYAKSFGVANLETGQPLKPDALFNIGSTTKMFTAYTLLSLAEDGKLDINKPIGNYIKGLSPRLSNVTASQLLSHTSGLEDLSSLPEEDWDYQSGLGRYVHSVNDSMLFTEPGDVFSYSNPGFDIAGYLIEVVSGKPYADAVEERVLKPLGMNNSTFHLEYAITYPCQMSMGHESFITGKMEVMRPYDEVANQWPAGFLISNIYDMAKFTIAMMNNGSLHGKQILSPTIIKEMTAPHARQYEGNANMSYGYGMDINTFDCRDVGHMGNAMGFSSICTMVPERKIAVTLLDNVVGNNMLTSARTALGLMMPLKPEGQLVPLPMNQSEMAEYVGNYTTGAGTVHRIRVVNGNLSWSQGGKLLPDQHPMELPLLKLSNNGEFGIKYTGFMAPVQFARGKDGKVKYFHIHTRAFLKES